MKRVHRRFLTFVGSIKGFLLTMSVFVLLTYFATFPREIMTSCRYASDNIDVLNRKFESIVCNEPFDVVYTWVNGSDPVWLESYSRYRNRNVSEEKNRYRDSEELRYSLRSLEKNAPWIRRVYLVTDNQIPYWLNLDYDRIKIVTHDQIFPSSSDLPVFSSPAIEAHIHRIPELSNRFIYFNDDVFLGSPVWPDDFFTTQGQKIYFAWDVPRCTSRCIPHRLGDGTCDLDCNVSRCEYDLGDCLGNPIDIRAQTQSSTSARALECNPGCRPHWIGDNVCDQNCKTVECAFDAPDCGMDMVYEAAQNGSIVSLRMTREELYAAHNSTLVAYVLRSIPALYVDLNEIFSSVEDAKHSNEDGIFASVLSENVLVVVYNDKENPKESRRDTRFEIRGTSKDTQDSLNISFVISRVETLSEEDSSLDVVENEVEEETEEEMMNITHFTSRRLLSIEDEDENGADYYGDSLVHVNNIFTRDFGATRDVKRVPAHTPLAINVEEMERLQKRYASEYRKTSSNRFRSSDDVQFAFAYFHWLILSSRHLDFEMEQFFSDVVDTNQDGHVTENEIRTVAAIVAGGAPSERDLEDTKECLAPKQTTHKEWADDLGTGLRLFFERTFTHITPRTNSHHTSNKFTGTTRATYEYRPHVTFSSLLNCSDLIQKIRDNAHLTFEPVIVESPEKSYAFEMIDEDLDKTQSKLDSIRARRPKFVCVNDDVKTYNEALGKILHDFYESFFAVRSRFELPEGTRNEYLRLDLKVASESRGRAVWFIFWWTVLVFLFVYGRRRNFFYS